MDKQADISKEEVLSFSKQCTENIKRSIKKKMIAKGLDRLPIVCDIPESIPLTDRYLTDTNDEVKNLLSMMTNTIIAAWGYIIDEQANTNKAERAKNLN